MRSTFPARRVQAFTLAEVVICVFVASLLFGGIIACYVQGAYRAEWSGYSLAAQAQAIQQLEQAKSAVWDNQVYPAKNEITNMVMVTSGLLDVPISGTNYVYATNYTSVKQVTNLIAGSSASVFMVKVDAVWPFIWRGQVKYFTNTVANYYAPDTPDS